jgi:hypothetical protein
MREDGEMADNDTKFISGVMRIGDQWPGVFIQGKDALSYALHLRALIHKANAHAESGNPVDDAEMRSWARMIQLADLLETCRVDTDARS